MKQLNVEKLIKDYTMAETALADKVNAIKADVSVKLAGYGISAAKMEDIALAASANDISAFKATWKLVEDYIEEVQDAPINAANEPEKPKTEEATKV